MNALLQSSPGEGAADHPYASLAYARSLPQIGEPFAVPESIGEGANVLVPFRAGETLRWRLVE